MTITFNPSDFHVLRPLKKMGGRPRREAVAIDERGCWVWQGHKTHGGYGVRPKHVVHRQVYQAAFGQLERGVDLDHLCRNRACCNPSHLEPVTRTENLRRGLGKGATHHCSKLTDAAIADIRARHNAGTASYSVLATEYGVSKQAIYYVLKKGTWRALEIAS